MIVIRPKFSLFIHVQLFQFETEYYIVPGPVPEPEFKPNTHILK